MNLFADTIMSLTAVGTGDVRKRPFVELPQFFFQVSAVDVLKYFISYILGSSDRHLLLRQIKVRNLNNLYVMFDYYNVNYIK